MEELDDIIRDFDVQNYLESQFSTRPSSSTNICVYPCPMCGDARRDKFYINISGDNRNGHWNAYCCHDEGRLPRLVMAVEEMSFGSAAKFIREEVEGIDYDKIIPLVEPPKVIVSKDETIHEMVLPEPNRPATPEDLIFFKGKMVRFSDRGINRYIIERHDLVVTDKVAVFEKKIRPDLANRLVIPVYREKFGKLRLSYQARDLTGKATQKYVFPSGVNARETLYGFNEVRDSKVLILVEGAPAKWAIDNIGRKRHNDLEYCCLATFGKSLSEAQENLIVSHPCKKIVLAWDLDAASQSHKIAQRLQGKKKVLITIPDESGKDWDELDEESILSSISKAEEYSFSLAVKLRARQALLGK